jgi:putative tryptophan/tyrosine transport system substrate-binding protein
MRRREFIAGLGSAAAWPLAARAQQQVPRVGALMNLAADDAEGQQRLAAFLRGLREAGWHAGSNLQIDVRWGTGDAAVYLQYAKELIALAPDVVLASGVPAAQALRKASRALPIVFATAAEPVGAGVVDSLARPSGNITGFTSFAYSIGGKWLEFLRTIAPKTTRVGIIRDPDAPAGVGQFGAIQSLAPTAEVALRPINSHHADDIERAITELASEPGSGLIVTQNSSVLFHRKLIIALAAKYRLPAVYATRVFVTDGGLFSYGADLLDNYRGAAGYVDRILKGVRVAELPVQQPTRFYLTINLKTAKALGLIVPNTLLVSADELIE